MSANLPLKLTHAESRAMRLDLEADFFRWLPRFLERHPEHDADNLAIEVAQHLRMLAHQVEDQAFARQHAGRHGTNGTAHPLIAEGTPAHGVKP